MRWIVVLCFFQFSFICISQSPIEEGRPFKAVVKTNVLNLIMIPSVHFEYKLAKKSSLLLNFHRGNITFITENNWLNASIDYRKYFGKHHHDALRGYYWSAGFAYHYDYDAAIIDEFGNYLSKGKSKIGGIGRVGYQFGLNNNFIMDLGLGLAVLNDVNKYQRDPIEGEYRVMAGIGYRFK